jgi:ubiquinone/menaquinone biosynthesis C-methylase UbiE
MAEPTTHAPIQTSPRTSARADYGLDAPGVIRVMLLLGIVAIAVGLAAVHPAWNSSDGGYARLGRVLQWMGEGLLIGSRLMTLSSRWGKLRARDRLLDQMGLAGTETVVDVGCGHGLMLIGAAKRLTTGRAIGVDLWSQVDQKSNSSDATIANARIEGVIDRIEVRDGDMRALPLGDASVDVVVSSLAIHNVKTREDRRKAIQEIVRVLRPGGRVGIIDIAHTAYYANDLREAGMRDVRMRGFARWIYPPAGVLTAIK